MKFDIARAWKDESYRQTLSEEQLNSLPANPVGELTDAELTDVFGGSGYGGNGYGGNGFGGDYGVGVASSSSASHQVFRGHSYSVVCDINIFSVDAHVLGLDRLINIGSCETRPCLNND